MKKILVISAIALVISVAGFATVKANRSYFVPSVTTSIATSTTSTFPTAATRVTLDLDAYTYAPTALNSATLLIQVVSTTSTSVVTFTPQYSQDGIDWFVDNLSTTTTASNIVLGTSRTFSITGNAVSSTTRVVVSIPTPTRYVRISAANTVASSTLWMQWVPIREMTQ